MESITARSDVDSTPAEDSWAHTPENSARIARARRQRGYRLSEDDLLELIERAEQAQRSGREYRPTPAELEAMEAKHLAAGE